MRASGREIWVSVVAIRRREASPSPVRTRHLAAGKGKTSAIELCHGNTHAANIQFLGARCRCDATHGAGELARLRNLNLSLPRAHARGRFPPTFELGPPDINTSSLSNSPIAPARLCQYEAHRGT